MRVESSFDSNLPGGRNDLTKRRCFLPPMCQGHGRCTPGAGCQTRKQDEERPLSSTTVKPMHELQRSTFPSQNPKAYVGGQPAKQVLFGRPSRGSTCHGSIEKQDWPELLCFGIIAAEGARPERLNHIGFYPILVCPKPCGHPASSGWFRCSSGCTDGASTSLCRLFN